MSSPLNPAAKEFFPSSWGSCWSSGEQVEREECNEDHITPEELEELEAAEEWVMAMVDFEEDEEDHLSAQQEAAKPPAATA